MQARPDQVRLAGTGIRIGWFVHVGAKLCVGTRHWAACKLAAHVGVRPCMGSRRWAVLGPVRATLVCVHGLH